MASTYLTRTPSSASNRKTWTWSGWVKRGTLGADQDLFNAYNPSGFWERFYFNSSDFLYYDHDIAGTDFTLQSQMVFRDTNAWYHLVFAKDTTQSTEADRLKIYVNGVQIALNEVALGYPTQNYEGDINNTFAHSIGTLNSGAYFDGSMSHVNFIDGTAYDASAFGETDATTGEWKIKTSPSVTYGTNGFFILKDGNSVTDQSGNSNNFTVGGGTLTNTEDSPSNVFATLNPLGGRNGSGKGTYSNGNTTWVSSTTDQDACNSTIAIDDGGKYYCEMKCVSRTGAYYNPGIYSAVQDSYNSANPSVFARGDGVIYNNGSVSQSGLASINDGDIIGMAYDGSGATHTFQLYKNGSAYGSAENITNTPDYPLFFGDGTNSGSVSNTVSFNFGNGYFGTTAVSSAGTNASGNGIFEYDVPTGYTALSTKGLNL